MIYIQIEDFGPRLIRWYAACGTLTFGCRTPPFEDQHSLNLLHGAA